MAQTYFYDGQIRRFLVQFIRMVSNIQVKMGRDEDGSAILQTVPVIYGDPSRQAAQILRNNSENTAMTVPIMAVYINGLKYDRERVQEPYHVSKLNIRERKYNEATGEYEQGQGDAFTVERLMPVPYTVALKLDIWTSNFDQKLQFFEQLSVLFNPSFEIQSTDNYIDWTSLSHVLLTDTNWSSRSVGTSADDQIDIMTMSFDLPIWISAPAKVKKLGVIQKIIQSVYDVNGDLSADVLNQADSDLLTRRVITPLQYELIYLADGSGNGTLKLLKENETVVDGEIIDSGEKDIWRTLVDLYGSLRNGTSQVRLLQNGGDTEIVGTVAYHPADETVLLFTPFTDTLPANSITPINAIINPQTVTVNSDILSPAAGTRYLILGNIGAASNSEGAVAWRGADNHDLVAVANDIIEYNGTRWVVSFNHANEAADKYVTNLKTMTQYHWTGKGWVKSYEGRYRAGDWSLVL